MTFAQKGEEYDIDKQGVAESKERVIFNPTAF
jgi:hypothetical protein